MIHQLRRLWWNESRDLLRSKRIGDVVNSNAGILLRGEEALFADEAVRSVLVDVVWAEVPAFATIVGVVGLGAG